ncbi:hypoxanthine phosphoribosyltransferase [Pectinatus brassicae]|uniref:Hypoxanthine phosphoribosyltransferase n=1 Tax=Pectinatus brassicae TaxID=862415 RepID=A0A840USE5_9FIRM|nr:hypoxanthine phosphoribosyltransferase [Pectinatus brassicae]MBB5335445.1 hypoxanthine phosphoribosyltransferase [Pectinatus brassicae]
MHKDLEKVVFTEEQIKKRVKELGEEITRDYDGKEIVAVGILKGAIVFFADLIREIKVPVKFDFMAASSYGSSTKTSGTVRILKDIDTDIENKHVIIIEDIIDSGLTLKYLKENFEHRKAASVKLCAMLNKPEGRRTDIKGDYVGFDVPDEFIVGYGLDYASVYRNIPYIGILKKEIYS